MISGTSSITIVVIEKLMFGLSSIGRRKRSFLCTNHLIPKKGSVIVFENGDRSFVDKNDVVQYHCNKNKVVYLEKACRFKVRALDTKKD